MLQFIWYVKVLLMLCGLMQGPVDNRPVPKEAWVALKHWALVDETVGPHEKWLEGRFYSEFEYCWQRHWWLRDAPRISLWYQLPIEGAGKKAELACQYLNCLENKRELGEYNRYRYDDAIAAAYKSYWFWSNVDKLSGCDSRSTWSNIRGYLRDVVNTISPQDLANQRWPLPVPMEYMEEIP